MDWSLVFKHNPYHAEDGRFTTAGAAKFTSSWGKPSSAFSATPTAQAESPELTGNAEKAFVKAHKDAIAGMSIADQKSIKAYTANERQINAYLRNGGNAGEHLLGKFNSTAGDAARISKILRNSELGADVKLYRGTRLARLLGKDGKITVGSTFVDQGITSTSIDKSVAEGVFLDRKDAVAILSINATKKTKGLYTASVSDHSEEKEVILAPNTKFKVRSVSEKTIGKKKVTHVELDVQDD